MSDKPKKEPEADKKDHGKEAAAGKGGLMAKTPVILGAVMLIEAVVLFAGFKLLGAGSGHTAAGAELATTQPAGGDKAGSPDDKKATVELPVVDFRAPNKLSGRTFLYDVSIYVSTSTLTQDKVKDAISAHDALIKDRIRTIIAECDPEKLGGGSEPGLETLRRQVKYQLDEILGDGMIDEVLVPRCTPFRTDY